MKNTISFSKNVNPNIGKGLQSKNSKLNDRIIYVYFILQIVKVHFNESIHQSQDIIMEEVKSSDKEECKSKHDMIDIKKITNNLSSSEILQ